METQLTKIAQTISEAKTDSSNTPSRGIPKPEPFSGQITDDFTVWLQHFRSIANLHKWSPEVCAELLHTYLTGAALTFFQSLPADTRANFEATVTALRAHFDDSTIRNSLHIQLHNRKQNLNETVTDFCNDLEKRFLRLGVSQEFYKLLVFLDGLQPHLQFEVRKTGPNTYNQAKELARNLEAALLDQSRRAATLVSAVDSRDSSAMAKELSALKDQLADLKLSMQNRSNRRPPQHFPRQQFQNYNRTSQGAPICHRCNRKGHIAPNCFYNRQFNRNSFQNRSNSNFSRPSFSDNRDNFNFPQRQSNRPSFSPNTHNFRNSTQGNARRPR